VVFCYADGEQVSVAIKPGAGVEALYAPRRYLLDRLLVDAAAAAGAEVLHETIATASRCGLRVGLRRSRSGGIHSDQRRHLRLCQYNTNKTALPTPRRV